MASAGPGAGLGVDRPRRAAVAALTEQGWTVGSILEQEAVGRLAAVRLYPGQLDDGGRVVDLLFASSGIEAEIVDDAEKLEILPGLNAPVARIGQLIVLKALAESEERPHDRADLHALLEQADAADRQLASEMAALVERRGYSRGRPISQIVRGLVGR